MKSRAFQLDEVSGEKVFQSSGYSQPDSYSQNGSEIERRVDGSHGPTKPHPNSGILKSNKVTMAMRSSRHDGEVPEQGRTGIMGKQDMRWWFRKLYHFLSHNERAQDRTVQSQYPLPHCIKIRTQ